MGDVVLVKGHWYRVVLLRGALNRDECFPQCSGRKVSMWADRYKELMGQHD